jgi:hypothetical protein
MCQTSSIQKRGGFLFFLTRLANMRCGVHGLEFIILFIIPQLGEEDGGDRWPAHERVAAARVIAGCCRAAKTQVGAYMREFQVELSIEKRMMDSATALRLAKAATVAEAKRMERAATRRAQDILQEQRAAKVAKRWVYHRHDVGDAREGIELFWIERCEKSEIHRGGSILHCEAYFPPPETNTEIGQGSHTAFKSTRREVNDGTLETALCVCNLGHGCNFHVAHGAEAVAMWTVAGRVKLRLKEDSL